MTAAPQPTRLKLKRGFKRAKTNRGFGLITFTDHYGAACEVQKSSIATEDCIWIGCGELGLKRLVPGEGWKAVELGPGHIANTRMHLNRKDVAALLPILQHFVETGELP